MNGKKKLHDFFIDAKVANYKRTAIPLLTGGNDIVWIIGYRIDERFKIMDQTKNILKVTMTQL
jgi:tRNA(Ile)-lysidine synthase